MKKNRPKYKQIIDAAVKVIAENGYNKSQVSKIANQAGVADGTIYLYFKNKDDILISVFQEKMGQFIDRISQTISKENRADDKLLKLIEMHFLQFESDHHLAVVTQLELRQSDLELRTKINQVLKTYLNVLDEIIQEGIDDQIFQKHLNIPLVRQMIFGTIDEIVTNWVMKDHKYNLAEQAVSVHSLIIRGLSVK
jgi:TetR/AcrR family fatty acid metabolism transcriptional regulator